MLRSLTVSRGTATGEPGGAPGHRSIVSVGSGQVSGRRYEVVKVELADHSERTIYFDITENEKNWASQRQH